MKWRRLNSTYWHAKKGYRKFDTLTAINVFNLLQRESSREREWEKHRETHTHTHLQVEREI